MNATLSSQKTEPLLTRSRLPSAGLAAIAGCVAACSAPFVLVALGAGATTTAVASFLGGGAEIVAGGLVFVGVLGVMAIRRRSTSDAACSRSCTVEPTRLSAAQETSGTPGSLAGDRRASDCL